MQVDLTAIKLQQLSAADKYAPNFQIIQLILNSMQAIICIHSKKAERQEAQIQALESRIRELEAKG